MRLELAWFTRCQIPEAHPAIPVAHRQYPAIGGELHRPDLVFVVQKGSQALGDGVPDIDPAVFPVGRRAGPDDRQSAPVGREGQRRTLAIVEIAAREVRHDGCAVLRFQLQDRHRTARVDGRDTIPVGGEGDDFTGARNGKEEFAGFGIVHVNRAVGGASDEPFSVGGEATQRGRFGDSEALPAAGEVPHF